MSFIHNNPQLVPSLKFLSLRLLLDIMVVIYTTPYGQFVLNIGKCTIHIPNFLLIVRFQHLYRPDCLHVSKPT